jgi:hypothetical protein
MSNKAKGWNLPVTELMGQRGVKEGEVGIEIEAEGYLLPAAVKGTYWTVHDDGSLRLPPAKVVGAFPVAGSAYEYVLRQPVKRDKVEAALDNLTKALTESKAEVVMSNRCSVHIHLNCQGMLMRQVYNLITLSGIFESLLSEYCGDDRIGNLFCLRQSDAEFMVRALAECLTTNQYNWFVNDNLRYAFLNVTSLPKYNSVEFRGLRGTVDKPTIETWVRMLLSMQDAAKTYSSPAEIIQEFSVRGPVAFLMKIFPKDYPWFMNRQNYVDRMYGGMRLMQDLAFAVEWGEVVKAEPAKEYNVVVEQQVVDDLMPDFDEDVDDGPFHFDIEADQLLVQVQQNPMPGWRQVQVPPVLRRAVEEGDI